MSIISRCVLVLGLLNYTVCLARSQEAAGPVKVTIKDGKLLSDELALPLDPTPRIKADSGGGTYFGLTLDGMRITCTPQASVWLSARIDNQEIMPNFGIMNGQFEQPPKPLPPGRFGKKRHGTQVTWTHGRLHFLQIIEVLPSRVSGTVAAGQKRRLDTARVSYVVENKDTVAHTVEMRTFIDTMIKENDGALFAAPGTHPGKILDGLVLKDKTLPDYLQVLENPNLKNPGLVATMTLKFSGKGEGPSRAVLTNTGAFMGGWEVPVQQAGGDSACFLYWPSKSLKAGEKREMVWAYGGGIASDLENDGKVSLGLGGSFEPGKLFTIVATVDDPVPSQTLTLELPRGMERVEGKERQPVPPPQEAGNSVVLWKARVLELGNYEIRVRSSTGVTQVKNISVQAAK
jgi:hypothetical protein